MARQSIPIYQVDAFTDRVFAGNPAAVCVLDAWLEEPVMQGIAAENNLAETAFLVRRGAGLYGLRWFTPEVEMDLCGHATLASAYIVFRFLAHGLTAVRFETASGVLTVTLGDDGLLSMDFPSRPPVRVEAPAGLAEAFGAVPVEVWRSRDLMAVFESEAQIAALQPDQEKLHAIPDTAAFIVTAPGDEVDFVSRFFAPGLGIPEDPVTGSAHCTLVPFWAGRLGRDRLHARQLSRRGGDLYCEDRGERVVMKGHAVLYLTGRIEVM